MAITPVPPLTDIPTFPALSDRAAGDYNGMAFAFARHMSDKFVQEIVPVVTSAVSNATDAQASALLATQAREQTQADRSATGQDRGAAATARDQAVTARDQAVAAAAQAGTTAAFTDTNPVVKGSGDATKLLRFEIDGFTPGATRVATMPDKSGTVAMLDDIPAVVAPVQSGLVLLATIFPTASGVIDFANVFTPAYDNYVILGNRVVGGTDVGGLLARVFSGGTSVVTGNAYGSVRVNDGEPALTSMTSATSMLLGAGGNTNFEIKVSRNFDSIYFFESKIQEYINGTSMRQTTRFSSATATNISGIRLYPASGNFTAVGAVRVFGIKNQ